MTRKPFLSVPLARVKSIYSLFHVDCMFVVLQIVMTQRPLSMYFRTRIQPPPHMTHKDRINVLFLFEP